MPQYHSRPVSDGVVPVSVEPVLPDGEGLQLLGCYLSPGWVAILVQFRPDRQPVPRRRLTDEVAHDLSAHQRTAPPVLRDVAEHPVLDLVPLAGPRREVAHRDPQAGLIGEPL